MKPKSVDEFIASAPKYLQDKLKELRTIIRETVPDAEEKISYGMPYYGYKGRLAYFGYAKNHIGFYVMPPLIEEHRDELKGYVAGKATIQFALDKKLPSALIRKLIKTGIKQNESKK